MPGVLNSTRSCLTPPPPDRGKPRQIVGQREARSIRRNLGAAPFDTIGAAKDVEFQREVDSVRK